MEVGKMLDFANKYGFLLVFGVLALILLYKYFDNKIKNENKNSKEKGDEMIRSMCDNHNSSMKELILHPFFFNIENYIMFKIPNIDFGDEGRNIVFKDILLIKFKKFLYKFKNAIQNEIINESNFIEENLKLLNDITKEYKEEWNKYSIPLIVQEKFDNWNIPRYEFIINNVKDIYNSKIINTVEEKMYNVLDSYNSVLSLTVIDAETALRTINGELTGKVYKGVVIGGIEH